MTSARNLTYESLLMVSDPMAVEPYRLRSRLPGDARVNVVDMSALSRGKSQLEDPIQFDVAQGSKATDVLWTQLVTPVCVSELVIRLLSEYEISGWSTYPVEVFDPAGNLLLNYRGLAVTGAVCDTVLPYMLQGELQASIVMGLPTIGTLLLTSLRNEDIYIAASCLLIYGVLLVAGNLIADISLAILDPRVRFS